jgi:uncharacterized membrane protein (UPF0127 family)
MQQRMFKFAGKEAVKLMVTQTFKERNRGLLALSKLNVGEGLLIIPCRSVHSFKMRYSIDLVYLDKQLKVVKIIERLKPNRMSIALLGYSTLELLSGEVQRLGITLGDQGKLLDSLTYELERV